MTGVPVRNLPFASWIDDDAWMEVMKGPKWNQIVQDENDRYSKFIHRPFVRHKISYFKALFDLAQNKGPANEGVYHKGPIIIQRFSAFHSQWNFIGSTKIHSARDVVVSKDGYVWATRDIGNGSERMALECWRDGKKVWTRQPVGPDLAVLHGNLFYLTVENKLRYPNLMMCNARTGKDPKIIYTIPNDMYNLYLERHPDQHLVLVADRSQDHLYFHVKPNGDLVEQKQHYTIPSSWILPLGTFGIDFAWPKAGLLVTKRHGTKTLWRCNSYGSPRMLVQIPAGIIEVDPWSAWDGTMPCVLSVTQPHKGTALYTLPRSGDIHLNHPIIPTGLRGESIHTKSADGTSVRGFVVWNALSKPRHLLMTGYGAYGIPSSVGGAIHSWGPLLQRGWAIGYTFLRGGGDHTEEWGKAGRRAGRVKTFEDFEALIRATQSYLQVTPKHTVIYGRSAGGFLVGGVLARNPKGDLMQGVYTEVPYVDVLRTTTNEELPLTKMEYNEFGNPNANLEDFIVNTLLSPADAATVIRTPNVFVLDKTAVNDSQVFAYESIKWIRRLREGSPNGAPKLCCVELKEGHFTTPEHSAIARVMDCALLDSWVDGLIS